MSFVARSTTLPPSPTTAWLAETTPLFLISVPKIPTLPEFATMRPAFTAWLSGAVNSTRRSGVRALTSSTDFPAAMTTSPFGLVMTPLAWFSTFGAIR